MSRPPLWQRLLIVPPILFGLAVLALQVNMRAGAERTNTDSDTEAVRTLRIIPAPRVDVVPRVLAYGQVRPKRVWTAVARVSGEIVALHDRLRDGSIILAGALLVRIDPTDYELTLRRLEADRSAAGADLDNLEVRKTNIEASLAIENRALSLAKKDLERARILLARGNISQASVDEAESHVLARRQSVQDLENTLALIPTERTATQAKLAQLEADLDRARLDLDRTAIRAPFDIQIAEMAIEDAQAVSAGQTLFKGLGIETAEVEARAPIAQMQPLIKGLNLQTISPELLTRPGDLPIQASLRFRFGSIDARWDAYVARFSEAIDPTARTVGIVVAVDAPYDQVIPGERPPLFPNLYVEAELRGPARPARIVVPRSALFGDRIYIADDADRLAVRPVKIEFRQADFVVLSEGLEEGDRVIVSDPTPAIAGMKIAPVADPDLAERLAAQASGAGALK